jgi:pimeloyl-ACP methyl ester carboxylesterase
MDLFAREMGQGDMPVVLLHGFGGDHSAWQLIQETLSPHARTVAFDLPGHGLSLDYPGAGSPKTAANAVIAALDARGIERAHLVGHSMGGAVSCLVALFAPQKVASLTLLAPGGFGPQINHRLLTRYAAAQEREDIATCLEAMSGWYSPVYDATIDHAFAARQEPGQREMLIEMAKGLARDGKQGELPLDKVAELGIPVTLIWGALDNVLPSRQADAVPSSFVVHRFDNLGHMLPEEAPEEMARLIRESCGF